MAFDFTPPDPEKAFQAIQNIKEAFNTAAYTDSAAQPQFEALNNTFNDIMKKSMEMNPDNMKIQDMVMQLFPSIMKMQSTMSEIRTIAETDSTVAGILDDLTGVMQSEVKNMLPPGLANLGGLLGGGFPGFGDPSNDRDQDDTPAAPPPKPAAKKAPRKGKGGGDFNL